MLHPGAALSFVCISASLTDNPATIRWLKAQVQLVTRVIKTKQKIVASADEQLG